MPRKKNPNNQYWNQTVEDAISAYNSTDDRKEREKQYKIIYPALCKVAEVLYHKVKFSYSDDEMQDVMSDCVIHLTTNLDKFDSSKGKSFSYFTVAARYFYIQLSNRNYKYFQNTIPLSTMSENWDVADDDDNIAKEQREFFNAFVQYLDINFNKIVPKKYEKIGRIFVDSLANFEKTEDLRRRKFLKYVFLQYSDDERLRVKLTKVTNLLSSHLTLFESRWKSGDESLSLCRKYDLTDAEKEYIKNNIQLGKQNNGCVDVAKKFGVDVKLVIDYAKSLK